MKPGLVTYFSINAHKDFAEDLYHDLVVKVLVSFEKGKYREDGKFKQWVLWVARNVMIDYHRYYKYRKTVNIVKEDIMSFESLADLLMETQPDNNYADSALIRDSDCYTKWD